MSAPGPSRAPPQELQYGYNHRGPDFDPDAYDWMLEVKVAEQKKKEIIGPQKFFERRTAANVKRDLSKISGERLATMREWRRHLFAKSKVFVWKEIEVEPWFVCKPIPKADKEAIF
ncbi:hypothetical protein QCA50_001184 [Cerrena zonata]|uniref:Uncharacterized protein n=1 Tax=Cerrena zonata TaxID=2478898 RepID=A0AAW0H0U6_9APHY